MAGFVVQQPNGLFCRFSTITDCPTHYNMTAEDYIKVCQERAADEARDVLENYIKPFSWLEDYFYPNNMSEEEFKEILKKMERPAAPWRFNTSPPTTGCYSLPGTRRKRSGLQVLCSMLCLQGTAPDRSQGRAALHYTGIGDRQ